ncbi:MAG: hypothetical protein ACK5OX_03685 [Desertimonas sp.]
MPDGAATMTSRLAPGGGIANRMRTLLAYAEATRRRGLPTPAMAWERSIHAMPNLGCIAVEGVEIHDVDQLAPDIIPIPGALDMGIYFRAYGLPTPNRWEISQIYRRVWFRADVRAAAEEVDDYDLAMHVRMTDMASHDRIDSFLSVARTLRPRRIWLACDAEATYERFATEFDLNEPPVFVPLPGHLRATTTFDASVDLAACARARYFVGTKVSSFSEMVLRLRSLHGGPGHVIAPRR